MIDNEILIIFMSVLTALWIFAVILKVYSYTSGAAAGALQYAIRFNCLHSSFFRKLHKY